MVEKRTTAEGKKEGKEESKKGESARGKERRGICPSGAKGRNKDEEAEWKALEDVEKIGKGEERREMEMTGRKKEEQPEKKEEESGKERSMEYEKREEES